MISARGQNGTVSFDGRMVTISHMNWLGQLTAGRGQKRVPLSSIAAVERNPTWNLGWFSDLGGRGFIRFTIPGAMEERGRPAWGAQRAIRDENAVVFNHAQQPDFEVRDAIEAALARRK